MEVDLPMYRVLDWIAVQVKLKQLQAHDEGQQPLAIVLDKAEELKLVLTGELVLQEARQVRGARSRASPAAPRRASASDRRLTAASKTRDMTSLPHLTSSHQ